MQPTAAPVIDLAQHAAAIAEHHRQARMHAAQAVEHARLAGEALLAAKAALPHGQWESWLLENCELSVRTAQAYMRLSSRLKELPPGKAQRVALLPLRAALRAIADARKPAEREAETEDLATHFARLEREAGISDAATKYLGEPSFWPKPGARMVHSSSAGDVVIEQSGTDGYFFVSSFDDSGVAYTKRPILARVVEMHLQMEGFDEPARLGWSTTPHYVAARSFGAHVEENLA
jgi:hypothetical protein